MRSIALSVPMLLVVFALIATNFLSTDKLIGRHERTVWIERLSDTDPTIRENALDELRGLALTDGRGVELLLFATRNPEARTRAYVAFILGEVGNEYYRVDCGVIGVSRHRVCEEQRRDVLGALQKLLQDCDVTVRDAAADALGACGPQAVRPALSLLGCSRPEVQYAALAALGISKFEKNTLRSIPDRDRVDARNCLRNAITSSDVNIRRLAMKTVYEMNFGVQEVRSLSVPILVALGDEDEEVRFHAAKALRVFGERKRMQFGARSELSREAEITIRVLRKTIHSDSARVSDMAAQALDALAVGDRDTVNFQDEPEKMRKRDKSNGM